MTPTLPIPTARSSPTLRFLKACYEFVVKEWPHAQQEVLPDRGFERQFRAFVRDLGSWEVSDERELHLGADYVPASGTTHEVDIVASHSNVQAVAELKNHAVAVGKNDVIVFFAKVLDYVLANPVIALKEICLAFVCRASFDPRGLAACLGLGIHPVCSKIRPLPVLANTVDILTREVRDGLSVSDQDKGRLHDLRAEVRNLSVGLRDTWPDSRFGYQSEAILKVHRVPPIPASEFADRFTQANSTCTDILATARATKASRRTPS